MTLAATRPRCATPAFAGAICATPGCGTILSAYRPEGETLCGLCRRRANEAEPERSAEGVDLDKLVAGILLTHDALHPGEPVNLGLELSALGIEADCWQVGLAVRHLGTRHGIIARGERGQPGYVVTEWERRYRPMRGFGGVEIRRDEETGQLLPRLLPQPDHPPEVLPGQLSILGSRCATRTGASGSAATSLELGNGLTHKGQSGNNGCC